MHPQHWPVDLDYEGRRVVVIGSGATAVTLVPAMAGKAGHVTMLQPTPSYVAAQPAEDTLAAVLTGRLLPAAATYQIVRWKNILLTMCSYQLSRYRPGILKALVRKGEGTASVATGAIDNLHPVRHPARVGGGAGRRHRGDGDRAADAGARRRGARRRRPAGETVGYKGMMFSGIPNLAAAIGYTNASWTLRCDLVCTYVTRLLNHMAEQGYASVTPTWDRPALPDLPFIDLRSGYVLRAVGDFPRRARGAPWRVNQNYLKDLLLFRCGRKPFEALRWGSRATDDLVRRFGTATRRQNEG